MADFVVVPGVNAVLMPDAIDSAAAAVTMDAVATIWHALHRRAEPTAGETVLVVGAGGLGLNAVQVSRMLGLRVGVVKPSGCRREMALDVGAEVAFAADAERKRSEWAQGGVDLVLEASGTPAGFESAFRSVRAGGRIVCCGYTPTEVFALDSFALVTREVAILGSRSSTRAEAASALTAVGQGRIVPAIADRFVLQDVEAAFEALCAATARGRVVVTME